MQGEKSLKEAAREAKKRLKSGFWSNVRMEEKSLTSGDASDIEKYMSSKVLKQLKENDQQEKDKLFYKKVEEIVDNEVSITNPLKLLMDDTIMALLDYSGKQRYILDISQKYLAIRSQILKEREICKNISVK